jgi:hypothetical protein
VFSFRFLDVRAFSRVDRPQAVIALTVSTVGNMYDPLVKASAGE